jgi:hypothetical protein
VLTIPPPCPLWNPVATRHASTFRLNFIPFKEIELQFPPTWGPASLVAIRLYPPGGLAMSSSRSPICVTPRSSGTAISPSTQPRALPRPIALWPKGGPVTFKCCTTAMAISPSREMIANARPRGKTPDTLIAVRISLIPRF